VIGLRSNVCWYSTHFEPANRNREVSMMFAIDARDREITAWSTTNHL
jgi:hypothetical protein